MILHLVGVLKPKRLGSIGAGNAEQLDDRLVLPPPHELKINHGLST